VNLCDRQVNEIVFLGAHAAFTTSQFANAAQFHDAVEQLSQHNIRALRFTATDCDRIGGESCTCDTVLGCRHGNASLTPALTQVAGWLKSNPTESIVIIVDAEGDTRALDRSLRASGIANLTFPMQNYTSNSSSDRWPTLSEMLCLRADELGCVARPVLLFATDSTLSSGNFAVYVQETQQTVANFSSCSITAADAAGQNFSAVDPLFVLNHYLQDPVSSPNLAYEANSEQSVLAHSQLCANVTGLGYPNVVFTDFTSIGDAYAAVEMLNAEKPDPVDIILTALLQTVFPEESRVKYELPFILGMVACVMGCCVSSTGTGFWRNMLRQSRLSKSQEPSSFEDVEMTASQLMPSQSSHASTLAV
jgi:hypothetical protein